MSSYGEYVSHVLGMLNSLGILQPIQFMLLFVLVIAGMGMLVRMMSGGGR